MNKEWDLSPLYTGLESPEFLADFAALEALSAEFNALCADLPAENRGEAIRKVLTLQEKIAEKAHRLYSYAELRSAVNTGDEGAVNATA